MLVASFERLRLHHVTKLRLSHSIMGLNRQRGGIELQSFYIDMWVCFLSIWVKPHFYFGYESFFKLQLRV